LLDRACSLAELGSGVTRLEVARRLMILMERALARSVGELVRDWVGFDMLMGASAEFAYNNTRYQGVVEGIDPSHEIVVRARDGQRHRLPCLQTALVACDTRAASRAK
jgi:hypothetical protein